MLSCILSAKVLLCLPPLTAVQKKMVNIKHYLSVYISLMAYRGRGGGGHFFCFFTFILVLFLPCSSLSSPLLSLLSLFCLSLGDDKMTHKDSRVVKPQHNHGICRPRWLSWMRRPTGDQEVAGSTPVEVGNILSWRLIMKYFLRSFSPFC